jgi:hypothetical protein
LPLGAKLTTGLSPHSFKKPVEVVEHFDDVVVVQRLHEEELTVLQVLLLPSRLDRHDLGDQCYDFENNLQIFFLKVAPLSQFMHKNGQNIFTTKKWAWLKSTQPDYQVHFGSF